MEIIYNGMILLKETVEEIDSILLEGFPPVFLALPANTKNMISKTYWVGPNSETYQISADQANKVPFSKGLVVFLDKDGITYAVTVGKYFQILPGASYFRTKEGYQRRTVREIRNRQNAIDKASFIFYVSPDLQTKETLEKRAGRPAMMNQEEEMKRAQFKKVVDLVTKKIEAIKTKGVGASEKQKVTEYAQAVVDLMWEELFGATNSAVQPRRIMEREVQKPGGLLQVLNNIRNKTSNTTNLEYDLSNLRRPLEVATRPVTKDDFRTAYSLLNRCNQILSVG